MRSRESGDGASLYWNTRRKGQFRCTFLAKGVWQSRRFGANVDRRDEWVMTMTEVAEWRKAIDPDDLRENDRFGPWVDEVTSHNDLPRRFRDWWPELQGAEHLLKVPRPLDRAEIKPGMDLYEYVVAGFPDRVVLMHAETREVTRREVPRDQIVATLNHRHMLKASWHLLLADGSTVEVQYNAASAPLVAEVDRWLLPPAPAAGTGPTASAHPHHYLFQSMVGELNSGRRDRLRPIHVEEPRQLARNEKGRRRRTTGMMALASTTELVLFNHGAPTLSFFRRSTFRYYTYRIPLDRITSFEWHPPAEETSPPSFGEFMIHCGQQVIVQQMLDSPDAITGLLRSHGVDG